MRAKGRSLWIWCAAGLLFVLSGCSLLSLYRYADWIILWQADHYLDLTSDQRHDLSERLTSLLARHRREAIPQYEDFLAQIQQRFERGLTSQDIDWVFTNYDRLRNDLVNRVIADSGILLASQVGSANRSTSASSRASSPDRSSRCSMRRVSR